jgi:hypothetical protein
MARRDTIVGIGLTPEIVDRFVRESLGVSVRSKKPVIVTKADQTLLSKNMKAATAGFFSAFGRHVQGKVVKAFQTESDPTGGKKWKKLSRLALQKRAEQQDEYNAQFQRQGLRGVRKKVPTGKNAKPLYLTGKLFEVASGKRLGNLSGGLGRQRAGKYGKPHNIQLTIYAGYRYGGPVQFGTYIWSLEGEKVRHMETFTHTFKNVLPDGTVVEGDSFTVPARPYIPKFSNQFLSGFIRSNVNPRYRKAFIASEQGTKTIVEYAVTRVRDF